MRLYDLSQGSEDPVVIQTQCPHCKEPNEIILDGQRWGKSQSMNIQTAFPELSASEREILQTGIHPECWDAYLGLNK